MELCSERSIKGREWSLPTSIGSGSAESLATIRGFDPATFFRPTLRGEMPDPYVLNGMREATVAFCDAVQRGTKVAILGDYDVDGATSTALVVRWLSRMKAPFVYYIPDRLKEGYGPNEGAVRTLHGEGCGMLLLLDSGTTAHGPIGVANDLGMEVVVIDHHEPDQRDPDAILVNPKRRDEDRSLAYLCTAGLAFLFLVAVQREMRARSYFVEGRAEVDLMEWIGIAALGTVCDVVPLVGFNRALVARGMPRMGAVPGIAALVEATEEQNFTTRTLGFVFGPCINATGRIGDTRVGALLLSTDDVAKAAEIARELVETNLARRDIQATAVDEALEMVKDIDPGPVVVASSQDWHPGVVGLVASRLKDALDRPAIVVGANGAGSCRSIEGFDMGAAVIAARESGILVKGGGHAMAAGLTVTEDRIDDLRDFMSKAAADYVRPPTGIDLAFPCGELDASVVEGLEQLQPFGPGNTRPSVAVVGGVVGTARILKGKHLKLSLRGDGGETQALLWNVIGTPLGDALQGSEGLRVDVLGTAKVDEYAGRKRATLTVDDAMIGPDHSAI